MIAVQNIALALKKELGSFFSTEAHRDNDIIRYINSAGKAIITARNFWFNEYEYQIVVTAWTITYSIPFQIETFFILNSAWEEVDFENFRNYNLLQDKSTTIWIWGETLKCITPWTYTIFYRWYLPQITTLTDSIVIPEHFYDLIIVKASYFGFLDIRAYQKASEKDKIFEWMIKNMATRESNPQPLKIKRLNKSKSNTW